MNKKKIKRNFQNILITGGCGFIGSNLIHFLLSNSSFEGNIFNIDKLSYAGNIENLKNLPVGGKKRYSFFQEDICNYHVVRKILKKYSIDLVINLAAESHVDRSIENPLVFIESNIVGTLNLLRASKEHFLEKDFFLFHHVSTDEVYGSLGKNGFFTEKSLYDPRSPYSASKASSDHLVKAYFHTFNLPITISNCSNNYGPRQFPEKFIPLILKCLIERNPIPVYGKGDNVRDWIHVLDHCKGIWEIVRNSPLGETYLIGANNEFSNIKLLEKIITLYSKITKQEEKKFHSLVTFVKDRAGHDKRYAIDSTKINDQLKWFPTIDFEKGLIETIKWYIKLFKKK